MKRAALAVTFAVSLLLSAVFVIVAEADPFLYGWTFPAAFAISAASPQNNTAYATNNVTVAFNVSRMGTIDMGEAGKIGESYLVNVHYSADWLPNNITVYEREMKGGTAWWENCPTFAEHNADYVIPDGEHTLTVFVTGWGKIYWGEEWNRFMLTSNATINFTVDTTPPKISVPLENKTYNEADIPLNCTFNEPVAQVTFTLDGQANATATENTTLTDLTNGDHNITVYATDLAGNTGKSETILFTVEVFPTTLTAVIIIAVSAVAASAGLLFHFKRKREAGHS